MKDCRKLTRSRRRLDQYYHQPVSGSVSAVPRHRGHDGSFSNGPLVCRQPFEAPRRPSYLEAHLRSGHLAHRRLVDIQRYSTAGDYDEIHQCRQNSLFDYIVLGLRVWRVVPLHGSAA